MDTSHSALLFVLFVSYDQISDSMSKAAQAVTTYFRQYSATEWKNYFLSTHFWGPVANWGLPLAALADLKVCQELPIYDQFSEESWHDQWEYDGSFMHLFFSVYAVPVVNLISKKNLDLRGMWNLGTFFYLPAIAPILVLKLRK